VTALVLALHRRTFSSLRRHRNYRIFFTGQVISVSGSWMQNVALAWLVLELSHSPLAVGVLAFCRFVPFTAFGLVAGWVTDRVETRRLLVFTQAAQLLLAAALATLALTGTATLGIVLALAALGGVALVFDAPGRQTLTFQLVGERELPNAVALNSSLFNASRILGPAIAGLVIAAVGVGACFAVNAVSFLAVLTSLLVLRESELFAVERNAPRSMVAGVREGLAFVKRTRLLVIVLGVVTVLSVAGFNFHVIVPLLASDTLHLGPETFGFLSAAFGAGALAGALAAAALARPSRRAFLLGTAGFGVTMLALAPVASVWLCAVLLFGVGVSFTLLTANANALVQLATPPELRGRVLGLYLFAFAGLAPVGGLLAGWLVEHGGTELSFAVAGVTALLTAAVAARAWPVAAATRSGVEPAVAAGR
jgi:MFS family permease